MIEKKYYTCKYCFNEFEPKRRRVQKYCSDTCRSKAHHARKTSHTKIVETPKLENAIKVPEVPPTPPKTKVEVMSFAGIGNAAAGNLLANGIKSVFTSKDNEPATKSDIKQLTDKLVNRYYQVINLPKRHDGATAYFDIETNEIVYSILPL